MLPQNCEGNAPRTLGLDSLSVMSFGYCNFGKPAEFHNLEKWG